MEIYVDRCAVVVDDGDHDKLAGVASAVAAFRTVDAVIRIYGVVTREELHRIVASPWLHCTHSLACYFDIVLGHLWGSLEKELFEVYLLSTELVYVASVVVDVRLVRVAMDSYYHQV